MRHRNSSRRPRQWFRASAAVACLDLGQCFLFGTVRLRVTAGAPRPIVLALRRGRVSCSAVDASGVSARLRVSIVAAWPAPARPQGASLFEQSVWQLEPLRFVRAGIEHLQRAGPDALDLRRIVHAQSRAFVQRAGVAEHVLPARFVDVEPDHLLADGALRHNRMKPPPAREA